MRFSEPPKSEPLGEERLYPQAVSSDSHDSLTRLHARLQLIHQSLQHGEGRKRPQVENGTEGKDKEGTEVGGDTGDARQAGGRVGDPLRETEPAHRAAILNVKKLRKAQLNTTEPKEKTK